MKKIVLHSPKVVVTHDEVFRSRGDQQTFKDTESPGQDITDYPIEEAKLDADGNLITKNKPPFYEPTGRTLNWSIKAGETLAFPEYVAKVLMTRYPFLEDKGLEETKEMEPTKMEEFKVEAKPVEGRTVCNICGQHFKNTRALALHLSHRHQSEILSINK